MAAAPPEQTRRRRVGFAIAAGIAALFAGMALAAASMHQRAMAYEFTSTAMIMLVVGGIMLLSRPSNRPGWRSAKIRIDTMPRLAVSALVLFAILIAMFFLVGNLAGTLTAVIEVAIFGVLLGVGFLVAWRRLRSN